MSVVVRWTRRGRGRPATRAGVTPDASPRPSSARGPWPTSSMLALNRQPGSTLHTGRMAPPPTRPVPRSPCAGGPVERSGRGARAGPGLAQVAARGSQRGLLPLEALRQPGRGVAHVGGDRRRRAWSASGPSCAGASATGDGRVPDAVRAVDTATHPDFQGRGRLLAASRSAPSTSCATRASTSCSTRPTTRAAPAT